MRMHGSDEANYCFDHFEKKLQKELGFRDCFLEVYVNFWPFKVISLLP